MVRRREWPAVAVATEEGALPTFWLDERGRVVYANAAGRSLVGKTRAEIAGKRALSFVSPSSRKLVARAFSTSGHHVVRTKADRQLLVETTDGRNEGGACAWVVTATDLDRLRDAEQKLNRAHRDMTKIERLGRVGTWGLAQENGDVFSTEARRLYGFEPHDKVTAEDFFARIPVDEGAMLASTVADAKTRNVGFDFEHRVRLPDGSYRRLRSIGGAPDPVDDARVVGIVQDVTEAYDRQHALRESEEWLRAIVESSLDGIISIDLEGIIRGWNGAVQKALGWSAEEAIGRSLVELLIPPERRESHVMQFAEQVAMPSVQTRLDVPLLHKSGRRVHCEISIGSSRIDGKHVFHSFVRDMTEKRQLQTDLGQAQKLEAMGIVAGSVAHDFNNMLAAISTFATLALESVPEGGDTEDLEQVLKATERATRLTRQLLAFTRKQAYDTHAIDLDLHVRELLPMVKSLAGDRVEVQIETRGGGAQVAIDVTQLELLLVNLVVNARDAMPKGGTLIIETGLLPADPTMGKIRLVRISVRDTGTGIPPEALPNIFDAFYTTKQAGAGTGLGLATVHGIVKQAKGRVTVRSTVGVGTAFDVVLPVDGEIEEQPIPSRRIVAPAATPLGGAGTVLLVEDDESVRRACQRALDSAGYRVLAAENAGEALMIAEENASFDLLLTDVALPRVSGPQLAERLAKIRPEAGVLFISGLPESDARLEAVRAAKAPFLAKPFTFATLLEKVSETLKQRSSC